MVLIEVETEIRPTEDVEKVRKAVLNVFEPSSIEIKDYGGYKTLIATSHSLSSLEKLHSILRIQGILDAARSFLKKGVRGTMLVFKLHKQAAYAGKASFVDEDHESPMGPIIFKIEYPEPYAVIDWLTPKTSHGRPLWEKKRPSDNP